MINPAHRWLTSEPPPGELDQPACASLRRGQPEGNHNVARSSPFSSLASVQSRFRAETTASAEVPSNDTADDRSNRQLRQHQERLPDWTHSGQVANLHDWAEELILQSRLQISQPCLSVENLRGSLAHFTAERDGHGLRDTIILDQTFLETRPPWQILAILLRELLHSWQKHHGRRGRLHYYNQQFRQKARELGLIIDQRGNTECDPSPDSPFRRFLEEHRLEFPSAETRVTRLLKSGRGKMKLYICACGQKARIGASTFQASCKRCGTDFVPQEPK
jgi:hypothetical protein